VLLARQQLQTQLATDCRLCRHVPIVSALQEEGGQLALALHRGHAAVLHLNAVKLGAHRYDRLSDRRGAVYPVQHARAHHAAADVHRVAKQAVELPRLADHAGCDWPRVDADLHVNNLPSNARLAQLQHIGAELRDGDAVVLRVEVGRQAGQRCYYVRAHDRLDLGDLLIEEVDQAIEGSVDLVQQAQQLVRRQILHKALKVRQRDEGDAGGLEAARELVGGDARHERAGDRGRHSSLKQRLRLARLRDKVPPRLPLLAPLGHQGQAVQRVDDDDVDDEDELARIHAPEPHRLLSDSATLPGAGLRKGNDWRLQDEGTKTDGGEEPAMEQGRHQKNDANSWMREDRVGLIAVGCSNRRCPEAPRKTHAMRRGRNPSQLTKVLYTSTTIMVCAEPAKRIVSGSANAFCRLIAC
jgi:hypothetical protein